MSLKPIRRVMVGIPVKWMTDQPTNGAMRKHCVCGVEMWIEPDHPVKAPAGSYVVEEMWQCASCIGPAEFLAAAYNSMALGYIRR